MSEEAIPLDALQLWVALPESRRHGGPVPIDGDPGRRADFPAFRQLEVVLDRLIGVLLRSGRVRERDHGRACCRQSDSACSHDDPPVKSRSIRLLHREALDTIRGLGTQLTGGVASGVRAP